MINIEQQKQELLAKHPDDYWAISDYGYGDGGCYGPFDAFEALKEYSNMICKDPIERITEGLPWNKNIIYPLIKQFEDAMAAKGAIHHISDCDRASDFDDFMSS